MRRTIPRRKASALTSIVTSGARCGVYVLCSVDMKQRLPHGFNLTDMEPNAVKLVYPASP